MLIQIVVTVDSIKVDYVVYILTRLPPNQIVYKWLVHQPRNYAFSIPRAVIIQGFRQVTINFLGLQYGQRNISLGAAQYTDPLWVKLYIFLKGLVSIYSISLVYSINLGLYKVLYYNTNFFYKRRGQGQGFGLDKLSTLYIKLQV